MRVRARLLMMRVSAAPVMFMIVLMVVVMVMVMRRRRLVIRQAHRVLRGPQFLNWHEVREI